MKWPRDARGGGAGRYGYVSRVHKTKQANRLHGEARRLYEAICSICVSVGIAGRLCRQQRNPVYFYPSAGGFRKKKKKKKV